MRIYQVTLFTLSDLFSETSNNRDLTLSGLLAL